MTMTFVNSDCYKVDGNGNFVVFNRRSDDLKSGRLLEAIGLNQHHSLDKKETHRIVAGRGVVTVFFQDGTFMVMHPSGFMEVSCKGDYYYSVYPDGRRFLVQPRQGETKLDSTYQAQSALDPETNVIMTTREDHLSILRYPDGSRLAVFPDGTSIRSNAERSVFTVSHASHGDVQVAYDFFRARNPSVIGLGSAFATKGKESLFERTFDGRLVTVRCDDGSTLRVFKEMRELEGYNNFRLVVVTLLETPTQKVIKHENYGEVVYIDKRDLAQDRSPSAVVSHAIDVLRSRAVDAARRPNREVNEQVSRSEGKEDGHFIQLFLPVNERTGGVYTADLMSGTLLVRDGEGNEFLLRKDGKMRSKISVSFNLNSKKADWDRFPDFQGSEYVDPMNLDLPIPSKWQHPLLALVDGLGNSKLFFNEEMLTDYFEDKQKEDSFAVASTAESLKATGLSVMSRLPSGANRHPANVAMPSRLRGLPATMPQTGIPTPEGLAVRRFEFFEAFSEGQESVVDAAISSTRDWRQLREQQRARRGVFASSAMEKKDELDLQQQLLILAKDNKNTLVYGQSNKSEISNASNVVFTDS
jgi:hypothetical protein